MTNIESLEHFPKNNRSCFVYGCFSTAANKPHLGFHQIPSKGKRNIVVCKKNGNKYIYDRRQLWIEALNIGRKASLAISELEVYVCSLHFARDDFYYNQDITGRRYLKENAVPRRNLPARISSPLSTKFTVRPLNRLKYRGYFNIHNPDGRKLSAPRRYLGSSKLKELPCGQSYTKTVWVVRKPTSTRDHQEQSVLPISRDGADNVNAAKSFSPLLDNSQEKDGGENMEEDEQCTILNSGDLQQSNTPWFTSELIIKEEPMSDSEQELPETMPDKARNNDFLVPYESFNNESEDDNLHEPDQLIIRSEDEEEEERTEVENDMKLAETSKFDDLEDTEIGDELDDEDFFMPVETEFEPSELESIDESTFKRYESEEINDEGEQINGESEDVRVESEEFNGESEEINGEREEIIDEREEIIDENEEMNIEADCTYYQDNGEDNDVTVVQVDPHEIYDEDEYGYEEGGLCHICGLEDCEGHDESDHTERNRFVCLICSGIFPSQASLVVHSATHEEITEEDLMLLEERTKSLTCDFCGRVLSTRSTLREHIMIHTGEKPHTCMLCGKSFRHKANLVVHVNGHAVISTYKCKKCNKAFTKKSEFEKHLKFHVDASGNPLVCKICNAVFKSQRTLYNHGQLHTRNGLVRAKRRSDGPRDPIHVCNICGRVLSTKATLKEHKMIHSGERPHECPICGRQIRHKANFVVHIQTHGQGKSYECDMCDEAFMRKSDLTQHKQVSHSKSKLIRCPICSEVFKSPQKFNRHMEIHESVVYMNETEDVTTFEPHLLEGFLET